MCIVSTIVLQLSLREETTRFLIIIHVTEGRLRCRGSLYHIKLRRLFPLLVEIRKTSLDFNHLCMRPLGYLAPLLWVVMLHKSVGSGSTMWYHASSGIRSTVAEGICYDQLTLLGYADHHVNIWPCDHFTIHVTDETVTSR